MRAAQKLGAGAAALLLVLPGARAADLPKSQAEFFENRIRPLLAEHCYECHSAKKSKGGLEVDWKGGWEKGGGSGPAIVPGAPEKSLLIKAVQHLDPDLQMPPEKPKLSETQIGDLTAWVRMGAPDPRIARPGGEKPGYASGGKSHWAFQPVRKSAIPAVKNEGWAKNEVDRFILAALEKNGLPPSQPAEKRVLLRRVYFDLIGLPPTPEQTEAFLADASPQAFEKIVDALLASPHYGERWGRYWLDVARYSDTKGQFNRRRESSLYPYAWTYRDYVIQSLNEDKPYDRFILEQLAADKLSLGADRSPLAALGFLTVGERYNGNANEIINDQIDTTSKAFLGLTVACARCHDHKFDPIPQADYYSWHGIFNSSAVPATLPAITDPKANPEYEDYLKKRAALDAAIQNTRTQMMTKVFGDYRRLAGVYLFATRLSGAERDAYLAKTGADAAIVKNWEEALNGGNRPTVAILGMWHALTRFPEGEIAAKLPRFLKYVEKDPRGRLFHPVVVQAFRAKPPKSLAEASLIYTGLFARSDAAWQATLSVFLQDVGLRLLDPKDRNSFYTLYERSDLLELVQPGAPVRAPVLQDSARPKDSPIFLRGEAENRGGIVPRRFLEVLSGPARPEFRNGSGRQELAQAIASKNNPLTARVLVNRVWQGHFGEGFVSTPDDLGHQSAPPAHPELLDYLASRFMEEGWSQKKLHRLIVLSAAYEQSSESNPACAAKDPDNRLLWRANIRRLEFEPLRDSILYIGGNLDLAVGGRPVDLAEGTQASRVGNRRQLARNDDYRLPATPRRTIYGFIDRADPVEELNTFDVPSAAAPSGKRYQTTAPQQALFLMNSPLVIDQVKDVVDREEFVTQANDEARVRYLYALFFQRPPSDDEIRLGIGFVRGPRDKAAPESVETSEPNRRRGQQRGGQKRAAREPLTGWQEYAHALLLTNEAAFVR